MNVKKMVLNQQRIFDVLKKSKMHNRLSHAYLFYGDEGVGKKEMAYALACLYYCPNGGCLECETCKTIMEGKHLNVEYIGILDAKKLISKEQITSLQEEFSKTSLVDGVRIYIVDGIDTASAQAQNSLLKFIEEPINQTETIGIFIATELANVVPTITSRCALVHFPSIAVADLIASLEESGALEIDACLTSLLTNNIEEAIELIDNAEYQLSKALFLEYLGIKNKKEAILFFVKNIDKITLEIGKYLFKWLIAFYEDVFKIDDKESLILKPLYDKITLYAKKDYNELKRLFAISLELYSKLNYNVSVKNVIHELISKSF